MQLSLLSLYHFFVCNLALYKDTENGMRTRTLSIHQCGCHFPCLFTLQEHPYRLTISGYFGLDKSFDENSLLGILSDLMYAFVSRQLSGVSLTRSNICSL